MRRIVFIGGIHGVGKTSICKHLLGMKDLNHYSASQLIAKLKNEKLTSTEKTVKDISGNQDLLINAIEKYVNNDNLTLLDGHFCLLNRNYEVTRIPIEIFYSINPTGIVVVVDSAENIIQKIKNRDGVSYDLELISYFQDEEIKYARYVSDELNVPFIEYKATEKINKLNQFLGDLLLAEDHR